MLLKHLLVLFPYVFLTIYGYNLKFESCDHNGWTCINDTKGISEVYFSCLSNYQKLNTTDVFWKFEGLPEVVSSVTLQNCNFNLIIEEGRSENLKKLVIRNITQLNLQPSRCSLFTLPPKRLLILTIENIKHINTLRLNSIRGNYDEVNIRKCRFGTMKWYSMFLRTNLFNFTENEVDTLETSAMFVSANRIIFLRNIFYNLKYGSFFKVSLDGENPILQFSSNVIQTSEFWGLHLNLLNYENNATKHCITFRNNKINCSKSKWLQRIEGEGEFINNKIPIESLKQFEDQFIFLNNDNVCIDTPCQLSIRQYNEIYTKAKKGQKNQRSKPKINVCLNETEINKYNKTQNTMLLSKVLMRLNSVFQYFPDRSII